MKNVVLTLSFVSLLAGCATNDAWHRAPTFTATLVEGGSSDFDAQIVGVETLEGMTFGGPNGLDLTVQNKTAKQMRILWDKSSLNRSDVFLSRLRAVDLEQQIPPQVIAPGETAARAVYQADKVTPSPDGSWTAAPFSDTELTLLLCLNYGGKDHFVIFHVVLAPPGSR
jgi:hypothetical protein